MHKSVHSRLPLRTLPKFRKYAEGCFAREWTCWKPRSKNREGTFADRPPTIPRTLSNTEAGRNNLVRNRVPFYTSCGQSPLVHDDALCRKEGRTNLRRVCAYVKQKD